MRGATTMSKVDTTKKLYYFSCFDGGLYIPRNGVNAKFIMNMAKDHLDYVEKVKESLLEKNISSYYKDRPDYNTDGCTRKPQVRLESVTHPLLTKIRDRIYIDNHKVIDPHMLTLLDWEALSIIYMADGCRAIDKRSPQAKPNYTLNIKGYSYGCQFLLKKALKEKLNLEFNINKHYTYYYLRLRAKDISLFEGEIERYILPSFIYKLGR